MKFFIKWKVSFVMPGKPAIGRLFFSRQILDFLYGEGRWSYFFDLVSSLASLLLELPSKTTCINHQAMQLVLFSNLKPWPDFLCVHQSLSGLTLLRTPLQSLAAVTVYPSGAYTGPQPRHSSPRAALSWAAHLVSLPQRVLNLNRLPHWSQSR